MAQKTDADEAAEIEMFNGGFHPRDEFGIKLQPIVDSDGSAEAALVGGAENGSTLAQDSGSILVIERDIADGIDEPLVPLQKSNDLIPVGIGTFDHPPNDGVEPGAIAAGGENSDSLCLCHVFSR